MLTRWPPRLSAPTMPLAPFGWQGCTTGMILATRPARPRAEGRMTYTLAVLLSGSGSNLQALLDAREAGTLGAEIGLVISDRADAYGLQRALAHAIPCAFVPLPRNTPAVRAAWEQRLLAIVQAYAPDLVVLAGFMRILSGAFLAGCQAPLINEHPAL